MSALGPSNPYGTDPQYTGAADRTLAALRLAMSQALSANDLTQEGLQATIDQGSGWSFAFGAQFTSEGRASVAKNLQADGDHITKLATTYRTWASSGHRDDGSEYGWGDWAAFASVVGSDLQLNQGLAWDTSALGPLLSAAEATGTDIVNNTLDTLEAAGGVAGTVLGVLRKPLFWWVVAGGVALYFAAPLLKAGREAVKAVT
jgi:hypothetical protein